LKKRHYSGNFPRAVACSNMAAGGYFARARNTGRWEVGDE